MKARDFSRAAGRLAIEQFTPAAGLLLAALLGACGGGGGDGLAGGTAAIDQASAPEVVSLTAQAMRKTKTRTSSTSTTTTSSTTTTTNTTGTTTTDPVPTASTDPAAAPATNLVANAGFESGLTAWSDWGNSLAVAGQSASGSLSLQVGTAAGGVGQKVAGMIGGASYRFTGLAKSSVAGETVYLGVKFFSSTGAMLLEKAAPVTSTAYSTFTVDAVAPAGFASAYVYVWKNAGSGYAYVDDVALAPVGTPTTTTATTSTSGTTSTASTSTSVIPVASWPNTLLQTGLASDGYWVEDGVWGAGSLTRGTYTGTTGSTYEQYTGVSPNMGPSGEVSFRMSWKWPTGTTEVKSYPSVVSGRKPGWYNSWTTPGGYTVRLLDGTNSTTYPSGATPGTFLPLQMPIASLKSSFDYRHLSTPTGRGHLTYDIWLQGTPTQISGFGAPPITHEIMIPLNFWGGYGQHLVGRNPAWYDHDVTIDGNLFHVYVAKDADGAVRADFFGGWKFIVFEPDQAIAPGTLDLAKFINYIATRKDAFGTPWANGNEYAVSVELGVEPVDGVGDLQISNYRVWK